MILRKFLLPLPDYYMWGQKSVGYIEEIKNKFLFVAGDGTIFFFSGNGISKNLINKNNKLELFKISSNLSSLTNNGLIKVGKISIKDILIKNNKIYISHINLTLVTLD